MAIPVEIFFGIFAALFFGVSDILAKKAVEKNGPYTALKVTLAISIAVLLAYSILFEKLPLLTLNSLFFALLSGLAGGVAWVAFYRAFSVGDVSVVIPIASSWGVIPFILALVILSEKLTLTQLGFSAIIFIGIFFVSTNLKAFTQSIGKRFREGALLALLAMAGFGLSFFFLKFAVDSLGVFYSIVFSRMLTLALVVPFQDPIQRGGLKAIPILVGVGILEAFGFVSYNTGISVGLVSLVSAAISTESLVAIALAFAFLKERLTPGQTIGIVAVVAGLVGLSLLG